MKKKIFIIVNVDWFFLSHRLPVALAAQKAGYHVTIVTGNSGKIQDIRRMGLPCIELPMSRAGTNIFKELWGLLFLVKLYFTQKPDLVHHVTPKIIAYGSVAARITGTPAINAVSGLGTVFSEDEKQGLFRKIVLLFFKIGLADRKQHVIFQNPDDRQLFIEKKIIPPQQSSIIVGSGVDLRKFSYTQLSTNTPVIVTLSARMLYDKGIVEFVEAAKILKNRNLPIAANFWLVGGYDNASANAVSAEQLKEWHRSGIVQWKGYQDDMVAILKKSHIVVLPSYREGLPKSLIEACAIGRPMIAFDVPGCREVVKHQKTGLLTPLKNIESLANAIQLLIENRDLCQEMGKNARILAENSLSIDAVVEQTLILYAKNVRNQ